MSVGDQQKTLTFKLIKELFVIAAEPCLLQLLTDYVRGLEALKGARPIPPQLDTIAFAILHIAAEYGKELTGRSKLLRLITDCQDTIVDSESKLPSDWIEADKFPFALAHAIVSQDVETLEDAIRYDLLIHSQSTIRWHCFNTIWFSKTHVNFQLTTSFLFRNIAGTLGYVSHAAGLARSFYKSDEAFLAAATLYQPDNFETQYHERVEQFKEAGRLREFMDIFLPLELDVCKTIESIALRTEWNLPQVQGVQLKLLDLYPKK